MPLYFCEGNSANLPIWQSDLNFVSILEHGKSEAQYGKFFTDVLCISEAQCGKFFTDVLSCPLYTKLP